MARNALHPLVTLLALSSLVLFVALPTTNARYLVHEVPSEDILQSMKELNGAETERENMEMVNEFLHTRMDMEINRDYPGSGANNRHTPNPPVKA